ncbi:N-ethylammeline chlorohydrolase [Methylocucumis oryzae]|uniref:N-ethylammeline chlorohydrolase n=1 Tax=Methylocucumis oryzae TaxID=1632867 RepID=A0A0F3IGE0_9GAMM|nr:N-ethylammeline chlorohydrolase [Methylocucumis oryzae]
MIAVDTMIHAHQLLPVEPSNCLLIDHSLIVDNGRIIELLPTEHAHKKYTSHNSECFNHHLILPGLVNIHTHAAMSLLRGVADDLALMDWLQHHIWPLEQKWVSPEFVADGVELAIAEMIRGGITCFNDMYFFPDIAAEQALRHSMRAGIGLIVFDFPTVWANSSADYLQKAEALYQTLAHEPLIKMTLAPHAPYTVSDQPLSKIAELSQRYNLPVHMHVHETADEVAQSLTQYGKRPIQRLQELGLINPLFIAVHATQLTTDEIALFGQAGVHIAHCPESNLKLASGFCPIAQACATGVNIAIGTDGAASNNDLDLLGEMRTAALLAKAVAQDASVISAEQALRMATINGAKALGLDHEIGSLQAGKAADFIAIDMDELETLPLYQPISQLVYATPRNQVTDVWIAGKRVLKQRQLTTFDTEALKAKAKAWQQRLKAS